MRSIFEFSKKELQMIVCLFSDLFSAKKLSNQKKNKKIIYSNVRNLSHE